MRINYKIDWQALGSMEGSKALKPKKYLILECALKVISLQGLHQLSITEIAKMAELSKPLVLYHYETKERILEDICFYLFKMGEYFYSSSDRDEVSFEEKIRDNIAATFRWYLFNKEVSDFLFLLPHLRNRTIALKRFQEDSDLYQTRLWERVFLESLRFRSMEELRIAVFGVRSLLMGSLLSIIHLDERDQYNEHAMRLKFNLESLLNVELPSFEF